MADPSFILFNKSLQQCRSLGARGGRAFGRNQRARRALTPPPPEVLPLPAVARETTAEAIAVWTRSFHGFGAPNQIILPEFPAISARENQKIKNASTSN